jgi:hypothetical protein
MIPLSLLASGFALAADDSKVKAATHQVEQDAKKIPEGKIGEGVKQTAKSGGKTVTEGAKYSGQKGEGGCEATTAPRRAASSALDL